MSKNLSSLSFRQNKDTHLFEVLVDAAAKSGTVPVDEMREAAKANLFGESSVIGAVSFYDFLKHENEGKRVLSATEPPVCWREPRIDCTSSCINISKKTRLARCAAWAAAMKIPRFSTRE